MAFLERTSAHCVLHRIYCLSIFLLSRRALAPGAEYSSFCVHNLMQFSASGVCKSLENDSDEKDDVSIMSELNAVFFFDAFLLLV